MAHTVMCRLCKQRFNTEIEETILVGQKAYYHKRCYEEWLAGKDNVRSNMGEDFWYESLIDYLYRDVKMEIDFQKIKSQWKNFTKPERKMTPKGIVFAVKYYYEIMKGDPKKAQGGIGIVLNIYSKSAEYWRNLEMQKEGTIEAIVQQMKERSARPIKKITKKEQTKTKEKWSLDNI